MSLIEGIKSGNACAQLLGQRLELGFRWQTTQNQQLGCDVGIALDMERSQFTSFVGFRPFAHPIEHRQRGLGIRRSGELLNRVEAVVIVSGPDRLFPFETSLACNLGIEDPFSEIKVKPGDDRGPIGIIGLAGFGFADVFREEHQGPLEGIGVVGTAVSPEFWQGFAKDLGEGALALGMAGGVATGCLNELTDGAHLWSDSSLGCVLTVWLKIGCGSWGATLDRRGRTVLNFSAVWSRYWVV